MASTVTLKLSLWRLCRNGWEGTEGQPVFFVYPEIFIMFITEKMMLPDSKKQLTKEFVLIIFDENLQD
jgi:hypothetical protein